MKAEKFELFMGHLGNGTTLCNKAVEENGDYKKIGHISHTGHIKLYVGADYIPSDAMERIEAVAARDKENFLKWWNKLPEIKRYGILLDELPYSIVKGYMRNKEMPLSEKVEKLTAEYMNIHR